MAENWILVPGKIIPGHGVASKASKEYPYGTLEKQIPIFKALGLDLEPFHRGTLNISISPRRWKMVAPQHTFRGVCWTDLHPPEDFSFSVCHLIMNDRDHPGWIYYPHPETKIRHFQEPTLFEVICDYILGVKYGLKVIMKLNQEEINIIE